MTTKVELWDAINEYAESCGGDTSEATVTNRRMNAVVAVERVISELKRPCPACQSEEYEELRGRCSECGTQKCSDCDLGNTVPCYLCKFSGP